VHRRGAGRWRSECRLSDAERERLKVRQTFQAEETGYQQIQGTKPQTIGSR